MKTPRKLKPKQQRTLDRMKQTRTNDVIHIRQRINEKIKSIDKNLVNGENQRQFHLAEAEKLKVKLSGFRYGKAFLQQVLESKPEDAKNEN